MNSSVQRALESYSVIQSSTPPVGKKNHTQKELVQLLFDGLTDRISMARACLKTEDRAKRAELVTKAQMILMGLRNTLDFEKGGELARNLDKLYDYCSRRISKAHATEDDMIFAEVFELMSGIRDAWAEIPTKYDTTVQQ
jgi:flagellar protein FliS